MSLPSWEFLSRELMNFDMLQICGILGIGAVFIFGLRKFSGWSFGLVKNTFSLLSGKHLVQSSFGGVLTLIGAASLTFGMNQMYISPVMPTSDLVLINNIATSRTGEHAYTVDSSLIERLVTERRADYERYYEEHSGILPGYANGPMLGAGIALMFIGAITGLRSWFQYDNHC